MSGHGGVGGAEEAGPRPPAAWWPDRARWRATGVFHVDFDASPDQVWDAWVQLTQTTRTVGRYRCSVRHPGDEHGLGLVRSWTFPMPGGFVGRSFEWVTAVEPGRSVSFEGVATPPLAFVGGHMTLDDLDGGRTRLSHVEGYEFANRALKRLSRRVHRAITTMNRRHVQEQVTAIVAERRRGEG